MAGEPVGHGEQPAAPTDRRLDSLAERLSGDLVRPEDEAYRHARRVWNGMINRYPAGIARCLSVGDVVEAVTTAGDAGLPLAVRGGGHGVAGTGTCDGGLVADLTAMDAVRVDPEEGVVRAEGGATWGDVDGATQRFGLATPGGVVSDTGIAGLTLGGGMGHLRRRHGLSCDNLVSADVVTADGDLVTASAERNPELFWALRGGGGNFGVVTSFEYECHPVGPEVATCFVWHPGAEAGTVLRSFREWAEDAPRAASVLAFYAWVPELPEFPESRWGEPSLVFLGAYDGPPAEGHEVLRPLREATEPIADLGGTIPYVDLQTMIDEDYPHGRSYYWKSLYLDGLDDDLVDRIVALSEECPSPLSTVDLWHLGGAIGDVAEEATAYANRDAPYLLNFEANWDDPMLTTACVGWVREAVDELRERPGVRGLYVNFAGMNEEASRTAYEENLERLVAVKDEYDPENLFRLNQNVPPSSAGAARESPPREAGGAAGGDDA